MLLKRDVILPTPVGDDAATVAVVDFSSSPGSVRLIKDEFRPRSDDDKGHVRGNTAVVVVVARVVVVVAVVVVGRLVDVVVVVGLEVVVVVDVVVVGLLVVVVVVVVVVVAVVVVVVDVDGLGVGRVAFVVGIAVPTAGVGFTITMHTFKTSSLQLSRRRRRRIYEPLCAPHLITLQ